MTATKDAERRLVIAQMRLAGASKEQYEEALATLVEAQRFLDTTYRRAEADKIIAKEKAELESCAYDARKGESSSSGQ